MTEAALAAYGRLLAVRRARLITYASGDGGLVCEDRSSRARPALWRLSADGAILPDSRYSFRLRAFVSAPLPQGLL